MKNLLLVLLFCSSFNLHAQIVINLKVILQGAIDQNGTMRTDLRDHSPNLIPATDPYTGMQPINSTVMNATGNNRVVDWVLVELRDITNPSQIIEQKAGILRKSGQVVNPNNGSNISLTSAAGSYFVSVRHRNHLRITTESPVALSSTVSEIDFTQGGSFGANSQVFFNGQYMLRSGDVNGDGIIKYTGGDNDRDPILARIGGVIPTNTVSGYYSEDTNLDGIVQYTNFNNDRDIILVQIGGLTPSNTVTTQLPAGVTNTDMANGNCEQALPSFLQDVDSYSRSLSVQAEIVNNQIKLCWDQRNGNTVQIYRKLKNETSWNLRGSSSTYFYQDSATQGIYYDYKLVRGTQTGYLSSGIQVQEQDYRGKLILVVNNNLVNIPEINLLKNDLNADGWIVVQLNVNTTESADNLKSQIQNLYNSDPSQIKMIYLLGDIPIKKPVSLGPDGHGNRPWEADGFYGQMTGSSTEFTLPVGRVDLSNLPIAGSNEQNLIANYILKSSQFKRRIHNPEFRAYIYERLYWYDFSASIWNGLIGTIGAQNITQENHGNSTIYNNLNYVTELHNQSYLFSYANSYGGCDSGHGQYGSSQDMVNNNYGGVFNMFYGSYFGNFDCQNNFLRTSLTSGSALTAVYTGAVTFYQHNMGMGDTIGEAVRLSQNNFQQNIYSPKNGVAWGSNNGYLLSLMGDPSLRMKYVVPASNLILSTHSNGTKFRFQWGQSSDSNIMGYNIYEIQSGNIVKINQNIITSLSFDSNINYSTGKKFMVRAVKLENSSSGTYHNMSLGVIAQN